MAFTVFSCAQEKEKSFQEEALEMINEANEKTLKENRAKLAENDFSDGVKEIMEWYDYVDPIIAPYQNYTTVKSTEEFTALVNKSSNEVSAIYIDSYDTKITIDDISVLKNLEFLKIRSFDSLPNGFYNLKNLKAFVSSNDLNCKLDHRIKRLSNLEYIESLFTHLALPPEISELPKLKVIRFYNYNTEQPFNSIFNIPNLETLWINFSKESQLEGIGNMKKLALLVTNKVVPEIGNLHLKGLIIKENNDTIFPNELSKLKNLVAFKWQNNHSATIAPKFVSELKNLEYIEFKGCNKFSSVPKEYTKLPKLKRFDIYYNDLYKSVENHLLPINNVIEIKNH
jgi:uncharacterized membrane protein YheB (UPF0754 family)